jgi:hypothetical protein
MQRLSALRRHHPSREGLQGGANGEVSWLRALAPCLPGFPVAIGVHELPVTVAGPRRTHTGFQ